MVWTLLLNQGEPSDEESLSNRRTKSHREVPVPSAERSWRDSDDPAASGNCPEVAQWCRTVSPASSAPIADPHHGKRGRWDDRRTVRSRRRQGDPTLGIRGRVGSDQWTEDAGPPAASPWPGRRREDWQL